MKLPGGYSFFAERLCAVYSEIAGKGKDIPLEQYLESKYDPVLAETEAGRQAGRPDVAPQESDGSGHGFSTSPPAAHAPMEQGAQDLSGASGRDGSRAAGGSSTRRSSGRDAVSIHAPLLRTGRLDSVDLKPIKDVVSIHAPLLRTGRPRPAARAFGQGRSFNPRPAPSNGATSFPLLSFSRIFWFQSTPRSFERGDL